MSDMLDVNVLLGMECLSLHPPVSRPMRVEVDVWDITPTRSNPEESWPTLTRRMIPLVAMQTSLATQGLRFSVLRNAPSWFLADYPESCFLMCKKQHNYIPKQERTDGQILQ